MLLLSYFMHAVPIYRHSFVILKLLLLPQVVSSVTGNKSCVSSVAESNILQYLLLVLYMLPTCECNTFIDICCIMGLPYLLIYTFGLLSRLPAGTRVDLHTWSLFSIALYNF